MKKDEKWKVKAKRSFSKMILPGLLLASLTLFDACKDDDVEGRSDFLIISETTDKPDAGISSVYYGIEGGTSTLYIFSNVTFDSFFQTSDANDQWVNVVSSEYLSNIGATRLTLQIAPLEKTLEKRTGTFTFVSKEHYLGQFLTFSQGFSTRLIEDFKWLAYGSANPYETTERIIGQWNDVQKAYGWNSTFLMEKDSTAFCYGRNGYIKLGNDTIGGDLISPFFANAITKDSMLIVSFNAVAYTSETSQADNNRLTVELLNGGVFSNGETSTTLELGNINPSAKNPGTAMWDNSSYNLLIKRTSNHPFTADMKIRFVTGEDILTSARNRVFFDNFKLYIVDRNSFYLANGENNMNIK